MVFPSSKNMRILLDLSTSLQWRGKHAVGILRTERELAFRLLKDLDVDVIPVVFRDNTFRALDPDFAAKLVAPVPPRQREKSTAGGEIVSQNVENRDETRSGVRGGGEQVLRRCIGRIFRLGMRAARFFARQFLKICPSLIREEVRQCLILILQATKKVVFRKQVPQRIDVVLSAVSVPEEQPDLSLVVHPTSKDVLLIVGLGWDVLNCSALAEMKRASGMAIASVSYDFIPTKFPQYIGGDSTDYFYNYFLHMVDLSDHCFCISECTRKDFIEFCSDAGRVAPDSEVIYLGSGLIVPPDGAEIADDLRKKLRRGRYALSVGTFEIRKNYGFLLSLWDELLKDPDFDLDLVIVGMPGWNVDALIAKLEGSPYLGTRIFWFRNMSDAGLSWLYQNCQIFLFPSFYEGWGLPVVEALQHERPVIVSNRGSVPEAGLGVATVVDIDDSGAWMREIRKHSGPDRSALHTKVTPPSWDDTAHVVKERLIALVNN